MAFYNGKRHIDGPAQEPDNSLANAAQVPQFCTTPSISHVSEGYVN